MSERRDASMPRATMPALSPESAGADHPASPDAAPWSRWLEADDVHRGVHRMPDANDYDREDLSSDLRAEDPMAPLVEEARRRSLATRRRQRMIVRSALVAAALALVTVVAAGAWLFTGEETHTAATPSTPRQPDAAAPAADATDSWCQESVTPERVVGAGAGDVTTAPGVILRLEHAWYVQRDPAAVRALLAPDARVAPESATREAIAAVPAGTRHCVTVSPLPAGRWLVSVDERHPGGEQASWQQVVTTAQRDGRILITAIVAAEG
ncbi:hypothetical protein [Nocardia sp. CC227C]|uniref:hypothetical protein n=1 Tax=Nocardia sp. CC227C TaxID=3044562 RepID=UPI00278BC6CE|nr:hypothetical protein [Nocardia sp. CC227C]